MKVLVVIDLPHINLRISIWCVWEPAQQQEKAICSLLPSLLQKREERDVHYLIPSRFADDRVRKFSTKIWEEMETGGGSCSLELTEEGVNGTYFLKNKNGEKMAVFKPVDEEADAPNNPRNKLVKRTENVERVRKGIPSGGTCVREVAAYLFDRKKNGSPLVGVPPTTMIRISSHKFQSLQRAAADELIQAPCQQQQQQQQQYRVGSLQKYVPHDYASWDNGNGNFPPEQVHAIGILDLMVLNTDRHGGNILVSQEAGQPSLIPIDHGFSFPENIDDFSSLWFEWLSWPQAKVPFSQELKNFILEELDVEERILLMKQVGITNEKAAHLIRSAMNLLKKSVQEGRTLFEIGHLFCRSSPQEASSFELLCDSPNLYE